MNALPTLDKTTRIALLALVAVLATIGLLIWSQLVVDADSPHAGLDFTIGADVNGGSADDCSSAGSATCLVPLSTTFRVNVYLASLPGDIPSYEAYDALVTYTGLDAPTNLTQSGAGYWTECAFPASYYAAGLVRFACLVGLGGVPSTYTGRLASLDFTCSGFATSGNVINLVHGVGGDPRLIPSLNDPFHAEGEGTVDSITVNCGGTPQPPPTITPPPTPTPTVIPHQGNIFPVAGGAPSPLDAPQGIARASDGSLYVADTNHCQVLHIQENGTFTVAAGVTNDCGFSGDNGPATSAKLSGPSDVALDNAGNLYIADRLNHRVRKVTAGTITTVAGNGSTSYSVCTEGSLATGPCLSQPTGVWVDSGNNLYIASWGSHRVMDVSGTAITTFAGNGTADLCANGSAATGACLSGPWDIIGDNAGNTYISSNQGHVVHKVTGDLIATVAGNGTAGSCASGSAATGACLNYPAGIDLSGSDLYIASAGNGLIRRVNNDIIYTDASGLNSPHGVAIGGASGVYASEIGNDRLLLITPALGLRTTLGADFCGDMLVAISASCLSEPGDVAIDLAGNLFIADPANHRVRRVNASDAHIVTVAGKTSSTNCAADGGQASNLCLVEPRNIAVSPDNNWLYISDVSAHEIWRVNLTSGTVRRMAGNGSAGLCSDDSSSHGACLDQPRGLTIKQSGGGTDQYLYIAEGGNNGRVLRLDLLGETIRTVLSDGNLSTDVALGTDSSLYVAEPGAHQVTRVAPGSGVVDGTAFDGSESSGVVVGTGSPGLATDGTVATSAALGSPVGVYVDDVDGDGRVHLLISDSSNHRLWVVTPGTGTPTVVDGEPSELIYRIAGGGSPTPGFCGDPVAKPSPTPLNTFNARLACLNTPGDLAYDNPNLALYFADEGNNRVRKIPSDCDADGLTDKAEWNGLMLKSGLTPWATPAPMTPTPPPGTARTNPCKSDTDGDGCTDAQEVGPNQLAGGRRDPTNPWDFFNPLKSAPVGGQTIGDVLLVVQQYNKNDNDGNPGLFPYAPGYTPDTDRTGIPGGNSWNLGPPDGMQGIIDVLAAVKQYNHNCAP